MQQSSCPSKLSWEKDSPPAGECAQSPTSFSTSLCIYSTLKSQTLGWILIGEHRAQCPCDPSSGYEVPNLRAEGRRFLEVIGTPEQLWVALLLSYLRGKERDWSAKGTIFLLKTL
jgi:hypothetical protein